MALTTCSVDTNVIANLGTTPEERGLTTDQFKAKFDEAVTGMKDFYNNTTKAEVDAHLGEYATDFSTGTWTYELAVDGVIKKSGTANYYKLKSKYILAIPQIDYTPGANITPSTKISIGGFPIPLLDNSCYRISGWFGGVGTVIFDGKYAIATSDIIFYTANPVVTAYKPTITTDGMTVYGINIVG